MSSTGQHRPHEMVAAGIVQVLCDVGERYGVPRSELLYVAGFEPHELTDPDERLPAEAFIEMGRYLLERSGDRALGIRFAEAMDLRTQGFWGYAFLSSLNLRQAAELLIRFQRLRRCRGGWRAEFSYRVGAGWAVFEWQGNPPAGVEWIVGDAFLACFCLHRIRWMPPPLSPMHAWLSYPEQPHHAELRRLVGGPVVFDAPFNRWQIPAAELDVPNHRADPYLGQLAQQQLERRLLQAGARRARDLSEEVRRRLVVRLAQDASVERVARDLRLSARTLRRRLEELGMSFQRLLEEVRHTRAIEYLANSDEAIELIALRLGYADPSNFRRAFRRWTGMPPAAFRAEQRAHKLNGTGAG